MDRIQTPAPQAAPGDSDPDMDEALRRAREGQRPAVAA